MSLKYGVMLPQGWRMDLIAIKDPIEAYETITSVAQTAEECGYAAVWLADHFHTTIPGPSQEMLFESWTSMAALASDTRRVRIGQMVTGNSYRNPALLAKMASTVDVISHGRLTLGLGAGWYEQEYRAYGYDFPSASERARQLREAVQVILEMWTQKEATFEGNYYQIRGAINQPKGVQHPHIPLLIAGGGEQVTLKVVAQYADVCNVLGDLAEIEHKFTVLKQHCEAVRRDYERIRRTTMIPCIIGDTDEQAQALFREKREVLPPGDYLSYVLIGNPETIRRRLAAYEAAGLQELMLIFPDATHLDTIRRFASEFIA
jgi:F420-dependent oxidoreductase-like protein